MRVLGHERQVERAVMGVDKRWQRMVWAKMPAGGPEAAWSQVDSVMLANPADRHTVMPVVALRLRALLAWTAAPADRLAALWVPGAIAGRPSLGDKRVAAAE
jgi:hypothetical protein